MINMGIGVDILDRIVIGIAYRYDIAPMVAFNLTRPTLPYRELTDLHDTSITLPFAVWRLGRYRRLDV